MAERYVETIINKKVIFKNDAPFSNCINKINNTQKDNAEYIDIVMPMYNLINIMIIIQKHLGTYGNTVKTYLL